MLQLRYRFLSADSADCICKWFCWCQNQLLLVRIVGIEVAGCSISMPEHHMCLNQSLHVVHILGLKSLLCRWVCLGLKCKNKQKQRPARSPDEQRCHLLSFPCRVEFLFTLSWPLVRFQPSLVLEVLSLRQSWILFFVFLILYNSLPMSLGLKCG